MTQKITLAGGCFWCIEAIFQRLRGVSSVVSGYTGGTIKNPTYDEVCGGDTGHAEVVQITFDSDIIPESDLLDIFFHLHDPTTLNRQGADVGTQYRSAVFYTDDNQKKATEEAIERAKPDWPDPIITQVTPLDTFYPAEAYHQNYFNNHPTQGYCNVVISPKLAKLRQKYTEKLTNLD